MEVKRINMETVFKGTVIVNTKIDIEMLFKALDDGDDSFAHVNVLRITSQTPYFKVKDIILKTEVIAREIPKKINVVKNLAIL